MNLRPVARFTCLCLLALLAACGSPFQREQDPSEVPTPMNVDHPEVVASGGWLDLRSLELVTAADGGPPAGPHLSGRVVGGSFLPPYGPVEGLELERPEGLTYVGGWLHVPSRRFHPVLDQAEAAYPRIPGFRIEEDGGFFPSGPLEFEPAGDATEESTAPSDAPADR